MYLEEQLELILSRLDEIEKKLDALTLRGVMSVSDIAEYLHISRNTLYSSKRYLLPNFGEVAEEGGKLEWTKQEVMKWLDRGYDTLRNEYEEYKAQQNSSDSYPEPVRKIS